MLGIVALVFIVIFCFKYNKELKKKKSGFIDHGVSEKEFNSLILFTWLYLIPLLVFVIPHKAITFMIYPVPIALVFFLPGIITGRSISKKLEVSGIDVGVSAGRSASKNMWLGVGGFCFALFNWLIGVFLAGAASTM